MALRDIFAPINSLEIFPVNDGLLIRLRTRYSRLQRALVALVVVSVVCNSGTYIASIPVLVGLILIAGVAGFAGTVSERQIQLQVTNREFSLSGSRGGGFGISPSVCSADIKWLEHQDGSGEEPEGLYAILRFHKVCVLPHVDPAQADQVIDRIEKRFPDMAERWRASGSTFGRHFITLGLNSPKPDR